MIISTLLITWQSATLHPRNQNDICRIFKYDKLHDSFDYVTCFRVLPPRPWRYPPRSPATSCICFITTSQQARVITQKIKQYYHSLPQALTPTSLDQYPSYMCANTDQIRRPSLIHILSLLYWCPLLDTGTFENIIIKHECKLAWTKLKIL